jgi:hypothetical protein
MFSQPVLIAPLLLERALNGAIQFERVQPIIHYTLAETFALPAFVYIITSCSPHRVNVLSTDTILNKP